MTGRLKTKNYTDRALAGVAIPKFCYVARTLRPDAGRLNVKIAQSEIIDNHKRIAEADPLGWIMAVMNGLPIPHFTVEKGELKLSYVIPSMEARMEAAQWLGNRVTFKAPHAYKKPTGTMQHAEDYQAMIDRTLEGQDDPAGDKSEP